MYDDALYAERDLEAGAMGYLNKQVADRHVIAAIRLLLAGQIYLSDEMKSWLATRNATDVPAAARQGLSSLSDRELDAFRLIGTGLSTAEIADKLFLSVKTVESHRLKIKSKLDVPPRLFQPTFSRYGNGVRGNYGSLPLVRTPVA